MKGINTLNSISCLISSTTLTPKFLMSRSTLIVFLILFIAIIAALEIGIKIPGTFLPGTISCVCSPAPQCTLDFPESRVSGVVALRWW